MCCQAPPLEASVWCISPHSLISFRMPTALRRQFRQQLLRLRAQGGTRLGAQIHRAEPRDVMTGSKLSRLPGGLPQICFQLRLAAHGKCDGVRSIGDPGQGKGLEVRRYWMGAWFILLL